MREFTYEEYIEEIKLAIKIRLRDYLISKGYTINPGGFFRCPNNSVHAHGDRNPTAHLSPSSTGEKWWCFRCKEGSDIFHAAAYIDGLPLKGPEFMTKTIPNLCEQLGIKYEPDKYLDEAAKEVFALHKANEILMKKATDNIIKMYEDEGSDVVAFAKAKGLTKSDLQRFDIGYLELNDATRTLSDNKIPYEIQREICARKENTVSIKIFNSRNLLFGLRNPAGNAVGFAARNIDHNKNDKNTGTKYVNVQNNRVYMKGKFLYGLDRASELARSKNNLYIFEGYTDVITAQKKGIENCAAVCGTSFTDHHLEEVSRRNIQRVTFCLDGDSAGSDATVRTIEELFCDNRKVQPWVMELPEGEDPDSMLKNLSEEQATDLMDKMEKMNIVQYKMKYMFEKQRPSNLSEKIEEFIEWMISYVSNRVSRSKYIEALSNICGIDSKTLSRQLEHQERVLSDDTAKKADNIWYDMIKRGKNCSVKQRIDILDSSRDMLAADLARRDGDHTYQQLESIRELQDSLASSQIVPVNFGWPMFTSKINIPKDASLAVVGAYPNIGKSMLAKVGAMNVLRNNTDVGILYFSMDDPKTMTVPGLVANITNLIVNDIRLPARLPRSGPYRDDVLRKTKAGFEQISQFINENRLRVYDQSDVVSISDLETFIACAAEDMTSKNMKPLVIVDSIHSVTDPTAAGGLRSDVMNIIRGLKRMTNKFHVPIIGIAELRKQVDRAHSLDSAKKRPTLRDISETVDIEYRISVGMILHSPFHVDKEKSPMYWKWTPPLKGAKEEKLPILELHVDKNKEEYFKNKIYFRMNPYTCRMDEVTYEYVEQLLEENTPNEVKNDKPRGKKARW